ncbi:hypothetical protein DXG01_015749 [Tephrocybe rancida]|nr:hypothetical protein DXG01_015749 [Tephrocybe rancida]
MIFQTPKKLIAVAKAFSPWLNMSPARLFTPAPPIDESMILDPPVWPENVPRNEFRENGAPVHPHTRLKRCYGPNGSFHYSKRLKQFQANRDYNIYHHKRRCYEAQQDKIKKFEAERAGPVPLADIHREAIQQLGGSSDREDRIFLAEVARLRGQPNFLEKFERTAEFLESLDNDRARGEYADLLAQGTRGVPSFSSFQRRRRVDAARNAAAKDKKRKKAQQVKPSVEEEREERMRKEAERKKREYEQEKRRKEEEVRIYHKKVKEQIHREEIRSCLEQNQQPPAHLLHRQDLIHEIARSLSEAAHRKQQEASQRAEAERRRQFLQHQEALRIAQEEAAEHQRQRLAANAALFASRQAKLAEDRAKRQAELDDERRQQKERVQREREERARSAQEDAQRRAQEEAQHQFQQQQAHQAALVQQWGPVFKSYDDKWAALRGIEVYSDITFPHFPWPILGMITDIHAITLQSITEFFTLRSNIEGKVLSLKAEILKWHPDKLNNQLHQVHPEHREQVKKAGELVAKFLNDIKAAC